MKRVLFAAAFLVLAALRLSAQQVATGISRDTIRVGDPFRAIVRIDVPAGSDIALPDSLPAGPDLENAGAVRLRRDSTAGSLRIVATYPLIAWRPGTQELPGLTVQISSAQGNTTRIITLPSVTVLSVLPADTSNIEAKPPKDVLGGNRLWWPWIMAALLLLAAIAAAYWWYRRRRRAEPVPDFQPVVMPRDRALAELERIKELRLVERNEFKQFYSLLSTVLRQYAETAEPAWSCDLTTEELARAVGSSDDAVPLVAVLRSSDLVKFARRTPRPEDAFADLDTARSWITAFPPAQTTEMAA